MAYVSAGKTSDFEPGEMKVVTVGGKPATARFTVK